MISRYSGHDSLRIRRHLVLLVCEPNESSSKFPAMKITQRLVSIYNAYLINKVCKTKCLGLILYFFYWY